MLVPRYPSKIIGIDLGKYKGRLLCHRDSFLCGESGLNITARYVLKPISVI